MHLPKYHRVDIYGYSVLAERFFGVDLGGLDSLVDLNGNLIDKWHYHEKTGSANGRQFSQP